MVSNVLAEMGLPLFDTSALDTLTQPLVASSTANVRPDLSIAAGRPSQSISASISSLSDIASTSNAMVPKDG
jgi:hypothetical protein